MDERIARLILLLASQQAAEMASIKRNLAAELAARDGDDRLDLLPAMANVQDASDVNDAGIAALKEVLGIESPCKGVPDADDGKPE